MSSISEDIIRETFSSLAKAIGVQIDIPDEMITDLAATLQSEIDRLEAAETESFEFLNELALAFRRGEKNARPQHTPILEGIRAVLAHLASTNRLRALFPATEPAEEVKPIGWYRAMTRKFATAHFGFPEVTGLFERTHTASDGGVWGYCGGEWELRAYPPAPAEPAEECRSFPTIQDVPNNTLFHTHGGEGSSLFVRNQSGDLRLCLNAGPEWSKLLRDEDFLPSSGPYMEVPWSKFPQPPADPFAHPAPAEPAEEETKAELCAGGGDMHPCVLPAGHAGAHTDSRGLRWNYPTSSPVVPAPTETGPWQRIEDVPVGVLQIKDRHGRTWLMVGGTWRFEWHDGNWYEPHTNINAQAPFVAAAEEGWT